ncbi:MAG: MgtC/SapB family protein [Clostridium sp.]
MEILNNLNIASILLRLILALICGGVLGFERGIKKRPAGFRTYMLVCVASALVMITNEFILKQYPNVDPSRMGAQVISGIGFLGVGTIIVTGKNKVKGLTTAAGLWASACIGLAIGIGFYVGAILGCIIIFIAMDLLNGVEKYITSSRYEFSIYVEFGSIVDMEKFLVYVKEQSLEILDMEIKKSKKDNEVRVLGTFTIKSKKKHTKVELISILSKCDGTCCVEEL